MAGGSLCTEYPAIDNADTKAYPGAMPQRAFLTTTYIVASKSTGVFRWTGKVWRKARR